MTANNRALWVALILIGALASAMTINFSGPYLAQLKTNPFTDPVHRLTYGYAWASVLEIMTAMVLFMLHASPIEAEGFWPRLFLAPAGRQWMRTLASLVLAAQLGCAFMEDARPFLSALGAKPESRLALEHLAEAKRLEDLIRELDPKRNPINAIRLSNELAAHKQAALELMREQEGRQTELTGLAAIGPDLLINLLLKLACIAAGGTAFYLAGLFWHRKPQPIEVTNLANSLQEVATNLQLASPSLQPEPEILQVSQSVEDQKQAQPIDATNLATGLQEVASSLQPAPSEKETEEMKAQLSNLQTRMVDLEQGNATLLEDYRRSTEEAKQTINSLQRDLQQAQALSIEHLSKENYNRLRLQYGFKDLNDFAALINQHMPHLDPKATPTSGSELSRIIGKSRLVLDALHRLETQHAA